MTFRVGQKVVCVDDKPSRFTGEPTVVVRGGIYTVTRFLINTRYNHPVVLLAEVDPTNGHTSFDADRFRPIVSRKTSIEIFTAMLTPQGIDA